ncbi:integral membrane sensor signal transduction histidine kinase [Arcobacter nitrofigilis DSM 7299]|uniref:histidine kinase n=1 Tax=Arcobacter nitrofigilis (strain ATCC 33309 / DSM 7299 / CCUG 15893 / LMG 7604 / NCTC 12251 / CI) TaxID=572480 RepID=D5V062_ARCNC|nr:HAMP domain-containing sensor histidine kinase [Arcobacter nitrofigilis]ADG93674.1 integral membrane sensor signal transduction histidine kinase [Arcobacter nitrofigilis DSM 7299]
MRVSLAWKWVIASLIIESLMLTLMVLKNVNQLETNLSTQTNIRLDEQKILLKSALIAPIVQMDYATINAILNETKKIPTVDYLAVLDNQNNCISSVGWDSCKNLPKKEDNPFSKKSLKDERFDTNIPISLFSEPLGKVYLGLSTKFYIQAKKEMITRSIIIALMELILSAILLIAISKWITKNLVKLTHSANAIAHGDYSQRINLGDSIETLELQESFNLMAKNIEKSILDLKHLNKKEKKLFQELKSQVEKNHEQDILLKHQSRMAIIGEMLNNIAHQWRQPLNAITVQMSGLKLRKELNLIEENEIENTSDSVMKYASYLSNTIDDFRDYIKDYSSKKKYFNIETSLNKAIDIVSASLKNNYINLQIVHSKDELLVNGVINELTQVFINILNNSKDILNENDVKEKVIVINFSKEDNKITITIQDNAGGVQDNIIDKIFDPYFTTKYKSQGTGIGLYMSAKIIHEHFSGEILVKNENIDFNDKTYIGAKFFIILPI